MERTVLIFSPHPDDAEIGMGGTIAHLALTHHVTICDLTKAEMSSNGDVETRKKEAALAAQILKIKNRINLSLPDRALNRDFDAVKKITATIREVKPDIIFLPDKQDRHPDHIHANQLIQEAIFNAKLPKFLPDLASHRVPSTYFYFIHHFQLNDIQLAYDVSKNYDLKIQALQAYQTQFSKQGIETPLTNGYLAQVKARDAMLGYHMGTAYAEGFTMHQPYLLGKGDFLCV